MWKVRNLAIGITAAALLGAAPPAREVPPAAIGTAPSAERVVSWPQFRGPGASGVSDGFATPALWNIESGENIRWRTPIPGLAHSSPVIHGDKLFVTSAVREGDGDAPLVVGLYGDVESVPGDVKQTFGVWCLDRATGAVRWSKTAWEGVPKYKRHPKGSYAASSPATDGKHVLAFFGTEGLYCYTVDGELKWKRDLGDLDAGWYMQPDAQWGFGSSPVIHGKLVLVQCDVQSGSFLAALSIEDGRDVWRVARAEVPTWSTPTVVAVGEREQIICNGYRHIGAYDLETGVELWKFAGGGDIPVPTPVVGHGLVFITNAHGRMAPLYAVKLEAEGEIADPFASEHVAWAHPRRGIYMQTPIVYGDHVYCCSDAGVLGCYAAKTGEEIYRERIGTGQSGFTASGVAADGKLYFPSEVGEVHVIKAGATFERIALNDMREECMASPAVVEGVIYFRTRRHVVAVGAAP